MTAPLTPEQVASMVADAGNWWRGKNDSAVEAEKLANHVRALAAEVTMLRAEIGEPKLNLLDKAYAADWNAERLTKEADRLRAELARANHRIEAYERGMLQEVYEIVCGEESK